MASSSLDRSGSVKKEGSVVVDSESELEQSLKQLSLTTPSSTPAKPARSLEAAVDRSPNSSQPNRFAPTQLTGPFPGNIITNGVRSPSRSTTPTLLRKASLNSLHSPSGAMLSSRRVSSATMPAHSPLRTGSSSPAPVAEHQPAHTAASIAADFFKEELSSRHSASPGNSTAAPETVVIVHDAVYGHRYSRPRTSRAALSTIVERPERIKATVLGVSAAYVRLGERHAEGAYGPHPTRSPSSIPTIPFRIHKSSGRLSLTSPTVTNVHGTKWMDELKMMCDAAEARLAMNGKELQRPDMHRSPDQEPPPKFHEGDLYLCKDSLDALEGALGGVCDAVDAVFDQAGGPKRAFVAIRPPGHHCSASYPSGFCWINNVHVGIMHAILSHGLTHAAIIDFDLHHGDGSQSVAWQHNTRSVGLSKNAALWKKTSIGYFSLHDINSYPCEMGDEEKVKNASLCIDNAHGQNIWNIHLQPWRSDTEFWKLYEIKYSVLLDKARVFLQTQTEKLRSLGLNSKAAIFLSAGFDASEWESAGMQRHKVNVPTDFYARFSRDVVRIAAEEGTSVEGRIISVLEGGYSDRALYSGVLSHLSGLAGDDPTAGSQGFQGLGSEMGHRIGTVRGRKDSSASERGARPYDASWWSVPELEKMEAMMALPPPQEPKKSRNNKSGIPPTYSSPTQASSAKAVAVPKARRSMSGLATLPAAPSSQEPPSPPGPPPHVPWEVAAYELSRLLIPSDRQTDSCTHEDLSAEATRARQARQSALALTQSNSAPATPLIPARMALRERKPKPMLSVDGENERKNRRKTVAGSVLAEDKGADAPKATRVPSRRLSAASTVVDSGLTAEGAALAGITTRPDKVRPDTSQSSRADSVLSGGSASTNPLPVKKTRTVNTGKRDASATSRQPRSQKKSPSPPAAGPSPSRSCSGSGLTKPSPSVARPTKETTATSSTDVSAAGDDLNRLAGQMKKIKITVVSKAQREAREKERLERERKAQAELAHPPSNSEEAIDLVDVESAKYDVQAPTVAVSHPLLSPENGMSGDHTTVEPAMVPPQQAHLPQNTSIPETLPYPSPPTAGDVSAFSQSDVAAAATDVQQQPIQRTVTPMAMNQTNLPVFTSTSAIPFAPRPSSHAATEAETVKQEAPIENDMWQVPDTPRH
ncbi:hypothetical protein DL546_005629 [Coniochaeta pulveracea]|uniref:Histone deacetylase domain-containing protein n=1 Tax=Coniochaeta pulveracea TaxID=177199 RepID=A0A420YGY5_9PEZI|nr:hypothetical protein DL546_005629 [Coniochaeta pulveracea]